MPSGVLSNDEFFKRLSELFESSHRKDHGTVLTQKSPDSFSPAGGSETFLDLAPMSALPILIRATNAKSKARRDVKIKLSTIVDPYALDAFYACYADVCKAGMTGMKKRDRSKAKEKLKAKKRKQGGAFEEEDRRKGAETK